MMQTIDGKATGNFWRKSDVYHGIKDYFKLIPNLNCQGFALGRVSMEGNSDEKPNLSKYKDKDIKEITSDDEIPVYSLGNVCYLTSHINRSKKGKNIPDFEAKYPGLEISNKYRKLVNYPDDKELDFAKYNKQKFEEGYQDFINKRVDFLIKDFKDKVIKNIK